eukprot:Opistho-2@48850
MTARTSAAESQSAALVQSIIFMNADSGLTQSSVIWRMHNVYSVRPEYRRIRFPPTATFVVISEAATVSLTRGLPTTSPPTRCENTILELSRTGEIEKTEANAACAKVAARTAWATSLAEADGFVMDTRTGVVYPGNVGVDPPKSIHTVNMRLSLAAKRLNDSPWTVVFACPHVTCSLWGRELAVTPGKGSTAAAMRLATAVTLGALRTSTGTSKATGSVEFSLLSNHTAYLRGDPPLMDQNVSACPVCMSVGAGIWMRRLSRNSPLTAVNVIPASWLPFVGLGVTSLLTVLLIFTVGDPRTNVFVLSVTVNTRPTFSTPDDGTVADLLPETRMVAVAAAPLSVMDNPQPVVFPTKEERLGIPSTENV